MLEVMLNLFLMTGVIATPLILSALITHDEG